MPQKGKDNIVVRVISLRERWCFERDNARCCVGYIMGPFCCTEFHSYIIQKHMIFFRDFIFSKRANKMYRNSEIRNVNNESAYHTSEYYFWYNDLSFNEGRML